MENLPKQTDLLIFEMTDYWKFHDTNQQKVFNKINVRVAIWLIGESAIYEPRYGHESQPEVQFVRIVLENGYVFYLADDGLDYDDKGRGWNFDFNERTEFEIYNYLQNEKAEWQSSLDITSFECQYAKGRKLTFNNCAFESPPGQCIKPNYTFIEEMDKRGGILRRHLKFRGCKVRHIEINNFLGSAIGFLPLNSEKLIISNDEVRAHIYLMIEGSPSEVLDHALNVFQNLCGLQGRKTQEFLIVMSSIFFNIADVCLSTSCAFQPFLSKSNKIAILYWKDYEFGWKVSFAAFKLYNTWLEEWNIMNIARLKDLRLLFLHGEGKA